MDLEKTLDESLDGLWNNRGYGGTSEPPRKDYQPYSAGSGYSFPYQAGSPPVFPPTPPDPQNNPSIPWPLDTVSADIADSFVYLIAAYKKMKRCTEENPSINKKQREAIGEMMAITANALRKIEKVGTRIVTVANIAGNLPPQSPTNS